MEPTKGYRQRWIALTFMCISLLVIALNNTVLNLALPSIAEDLGSSASQLQWIVDAYALAIAGMLLTMGYLGDRRGRKPSLLGGLAFFALFSLGTALSRSTNILIVMRAMMGISAASLCRPLFSILTATFRDPKERAQAIAIWSAVYRTRYGNRSAGRRLVAGQLSLELGILYQYSDYCRRNCRRLLFHPEFKNGQPA